jgi:hypothetical protein
MDHKEGRRAAAELPRSVLAGDRVEGCHQISTCVGCFPGSVDTTWENAQTLSHEESTHDPNADCHILD